MKKKTISIIIENLLYGGTTSHLINFINSKACRKYNFKIITNKSNAGIKDIKESCKSNKFEIIDFNSLNALQPKIFLLKVIFFATKPLLFLFSIIQMFFILKKISSDVTLLNCGGYGDFRTEMAGAIALKLLKRKNFYLLIHHCYSKPILWGGIINLINKYISKIFRMIFFVSKATKDSISKNTSLIDKNSKYKIIYNGVPVRPFSLKRIKKLKVKKGVNKIGMLSRIEDYKGHLNLIYSFSKLTDKEKKQFKVFFIGNGNPIFIKKINNMISLKNLNKYFQIINYLKIDSYTILNNFDITVSLTKDFEGFGYSVAESLFVKTPVISTNVGGLKEILNDKVANIVKPNDNIGVVKSLRDFLLRKNKWKIKAKLGRKRIIEYFNSEKMSNEFLKNFRLIK
jgi:teichuronic acid biosynthesis glycosyltransferase TuaC